MEIVIQEISRRELIIQKELEQQQPTELLKKYYEGGRDELQDLRDTINKWGKNNKHKQSIDNITNNQLILPEGYEYTAIREPKHGQSCSCISETGNIFNAEYLRLKTMDIGFWCIGNNDGHKDKIIAWKAVTTAATIPSKPPYAKSAGL